MAAARSDGFFDRDGWLAEFLEHWPVLGFVVAGIQLAAGNEVGRLFP
jgi:hypothetical protein